MVYHERMRAVSDFRCGPNVALPVLIPKSSTLEQLEVEEDKKLCYYEGTAR